MDRDSSDGTIPMPLTPALRRLLILYAGLIAANAAVWLWALAVLRDHPLLLGTAAIRPA
jgi:nickel/cobalt transporter (NiCoT) family protein